MAISQQVVAAAVAGGPNDASDGARDTERDPSRSREIAARLELGDVATLGDDLRRLLNRWGASV